MLLAIETSCDETAVSAYDTGRNRVLSSVVSSQVKLHEKYGGVVPELASREHLVNLPLVFERALVDAGLRIEDVSALAVTSGPGLKAVCLWVCHLHVLFPTLAIFR